MKKGKHVFSSTEQVIHAWANKATDWGRNSGSCSFDGDVIYSYRTKMGYMCQNTGYTILNAGKYSITTSGQQSSISQAIPYNMRSRIIEIDLSGYGRGSGADFEPRDMIKAFKDEVESICLKLAKARKKSKYCEQLDAVRRNVEKYQGYLIACKELALTNRYASANKNELAEVANLIKSFENYGDLELKAKAYLKEQEEKEKARLETLKYEFETSLQEWREHKTDYVKHKHDFQSGEYATDFVRLSKDGLYFETHRGAKVRKTEGILLYKALVGYIVKLTPLELPMQVGAFTLTKVEANGDCVVGCHKFKFTELEAAYKSLKN